MFEEHPQFTCPSEDTILWRYLDFTKFASLLQKQAAYFCRADLLGDPFEGSYPKGSLELREQHFQEMGYEEKLLHTLKAHSLHSRRQMYINCWHMNPYESEAMWHRYALNGHSNEGIAIQSTLGKLKTSFACTEKQIFIGQVSYIDYNNAQWMGLMINHDTGEQIMAPNYGGGFYAILNKRHSFNYENELRCIFWQPHIRNDQIDLLAQDIDPGHYIEIDLNCLIERVYVAPNAKTWFVELVENTIRNYSNTFDVVQSRLADEPVF